MAGKRKKAAQEIQPVLRLVPRRDPVVCKCWPCRLHRAFVSLFWGVVMAVVVGGLQLLAVLT